MRKRSVLEPLTGEDPPDRFRLFKMGSNPATDGLPALVDNADLERIMGVYQKLGRPLSGKFEHKRGETMCFFNLEPVPDKGLYAVDVEWTPFGVEKWQGWQGSYVSQEFDTDAKGHVSAVWGVGLTDDPASFNPVSVHQRSIGDQERRIVADVDRAGGDLIAKIREAVKADLPEAFQYLYFQSLSDDLEHVVFECSGPDLSSRLYQWRLSLMAGQVGLSDRIEVVSQQAFVPASVLTPMEPDLRIAVAAAPVTPVVVVVEEANTADVPLFERAVSSQEKRMIDESAVLAKFPGATAAGLVLTMPDGSLSAVTLAGDPLPMPEPARAEEQPAPAVTPEQMESMIERALAKRPVPTIDAKEIERQVDARVEAAISRSIVQPEKKDPPQVGSGDEAPKSGPVHISFRR